jgi:ABC-type lipoprotein release transport system permease subunit
MSWLESILLDVAFGLRLCRKNTIVTAAAVIAAPLTCLLFACSLSALIPALRAARVDPATALRHE